MRLLRLLVLVLVPVFAILSMRALSTQAFTHITNIPIPPNGIASMDISWGDAALGRDYIADRTNSGIDVILMRANAFNGRIPAGGVGTAGAPNGVATDAGNGLVFAGLGAKPNGGALLVGNALSYGVITTFPMTQVGGAPAVGRSDELAVDPADRLVVVANDQDSPPFLTEFSYSPSGFLTMVGQIQLPSQTACGIEQTVWVPETHQFMTALPTSGGCPGGIVVFNTSPFSIARTMPTDCSPAGMAHGPGSLMFVGCTPAPEVVNFISGVKMATLGTLPSSDEVWYDSGANAYEFLIGAPTNTLNIYSAVNNSLVETDPTGGAFHNLTADSSSQNIYVALRPVNSVCSTGCVSVFGQPVQQSTAVTFTTSPDPSNVGQPVTFSATVLCPAGATGAVTFWDGSTQLATVSLRGGSASFTTSSLAAGSHITAASYPGDQNCPSAVSPQRTQTVNASSDSGRAGVAGAGSVPTGCDPTTAARGACPPPTTGGSGGPGPSPCTVPAGSRPVPGC